MLCYRCGTHNPDNSAQCSACGQVYQNAAKGQTRSAQKGPSKSAPFKPGDLVDGRYQIDSFIGQGPVGFVYRVTDKSPDGALGDHALALKVIGARFLQTEDDRQAFVRALQRCRKVTHPGISRVYLDGEDSGRVYFTMQFVAGTPLSRVLELRRGQRVFTLEECEPLVAQICSALEYAHRFTAHGALKPDNIIVQPDDVKMTDFMMMRGLPRRPYLAALGAEQHYTAPELRVDSADVLPAADIYSLGMIVGEMLTGARGEQMHDGLRAQPDAVRRLIYKALDPHPENRHRSPNEFLNDMLALIDEPVRGAAPMPAEPSITEVTEAPRLAPPPVPPPPPAMNDAETSLVTLPSEALEVVESAPVVAVKRPEPRKPVSTRVVLHDEVPQSLLRQSKTRSRGGFRTALAVIMLLAGGLGLALAFEKTPAPTAASKTAQKTSVIDTPSAPEAATGTVPTTTLPSPVAQPVIPKRIEEHTPASVTAPPPATPGRKKRSGKGSTQVEVVANEDLPVSTNVAEEASGLSPKVSVAPAETTPTDPTRRPIGIPADPRLDTAPSDAPAPIAGPTAAGGGCPPGMVLIVAGRTTMGTAASDEYKNFSDRGLSSVEMKPFCVDRYEHPNAAGATPTTNVTLRQAKTMCESAGKRLCIEDEWERACKGPGNSRFPYGNNYNDDACNVGNDGEKPVKKSGGSPACRSGFGVIDMSGNVGEWVDSRLSGMDFVVKGGDAAHPDYSSRCANRTGMSVARRAPTVGFRCCADTQ